MSNIVFNLRWKEELEAISEEGILILECTMGKLHVYFPDEQRWRATVPAWAKEKWEIYAAACSEWCVQNHIPVSYIPDAYVYEEKKR